MSTEINHSFEWSNFFIWLWTIITGLIVAGFNLFLRSRDNKMAGMIKQAVTEVIAKADLRYVSTGMCSAAHKLTDQNLMTIRKEIQDGQEKSDAQYSELKQMINLILEKIIK